MTLDTLLARDADGLYTIDRAFEAIKLLAERVKELEAKIEPFEDYELEGLTLFYDTIVKSMEDRIKKLEGELK